MASGMFGLLTNMAVSRPYCSMNRVCVCVSVLSFVSECT